MVFQPGPRRGNVWDDVRTLDTIIKNTHFKLNGKNERDFEFAFMSTVAANKNLIHGDIHSQVDKDTIVRSVYLFGKKHRPDLTINEDGIAVEIKFLSNSLDGLKQAIGQSIFYRVRYRFVINLFVIDGKYKDTYLNGANEKEKDLEDICKNLSSEMNIFSYLVPAFDPGSNVKSLLSWNDIN